MPSLSKQLTLLEEYSKKNSSVREHLSELSGAIRHNDYSTAVDLIKSKINVMNTNSSRFAKVLSLVYSGDNSYQDILSDLLVCLQCKDSQDKKQRQVRLLRAIDQKNLEELVRVLDEGGLAVIAEAFAMPHSFNKMMTPLQLAIESEDEKVIWLIASRLSLADLEACTYEEVSLLHYAVKNALQNLAVLLLSRGFVIDYQSNNGITPLHLACEYKQVSIAQLLINRGANVNASIIVKDDITATPLSIAIFKKSNILVEILLMQGAEVRDIEYSMALEYVNASAVNQQAIYKLIAGPFIGQQQKILQKPSLDLLLQASLDRYDPIIQILLSRIYLEESTYAEFIADELNAIFQAKDKLLKPLLILLAYKIILSQENTGRPFAIIINNDLDIASLRPMVAGTRGFYDGQNTIYCAGHDPRILMASLLHESQHLVDKIIFNNTKAPFTEVAKPHFFKVKEDIFHKSLALPNHTKDEKHLQMSFLCSGSSAYTKEAQNAEVLTKVPEIIGQLGLEKGSAWLDKYQPALLAYYKIRYNKSALAYISAHQAVAVLSNAHKDLLQSSPLQAKSFQPR